MTWQFLWCGCPTRPASSCPLSVTGGRAQIHEQAALWLRGRRRLRACLGAPCLVVPPWHKVRPQQVAASPFMLRQKVLDGPKGGLVRLGVQGTPGLWQTVGVWDTHLGDRAGKSSGEPGQEGLGWGSWSGQSCCPLGINVPTCGAGRGVSVVTGATLG